jgi:hypothetical protein
MYKVGGEGRSGRSSKVENQTPQQRHENLE